ncbi:zinc finger protein 236-like [Amphiura filiformis]|uniref:zinc finger protein 236-like n=1 Tax=Amphiura filiformis TaxID=82378 RepID=UPI003B2241C1
MPRGRPPKSRFRTFGASGGSIDCEENIRPRSPNNGPYKCEIKTCGKEFPKWAQYRRHQRDHANDKPNRCDKCPASYNVEYNLKLHKATHNTDELRCPDCMKTFSRLASLKSHLMLHEKDESLICSECGDEFTLQIDLDSHLDEHREERSGEQRVHKCKTCGEEFNMIYLLKEHQRIQHNRFKGAKSLSAATQKRRVPDRSGFIHVCTHCGKSFQKPSQLVRHVRVHTGERPYKCPQCEKAFNQKGALQIHLSKHTGERRHICDLCQHPFSQKGNLRAHIARVHEINVTMEQSFPCEECPCVFRKLGSLNAHISRMHGDPGPPSMVTLKASLMLAAKGNQSDGGAQQAAKDIMPNVDLPETTLSAVSEVIHQLLELSEHTTDTAEAHQQIQRIALGANLTSDILQQALENSGLLGGGGGGGEPQQTVDGSNLTSSGVPRLAQSVAELLQAQQKQVIIRPRGVGRLHTCRYCNKSFKKPSDLVRHGRIHTHEKPFKCTQCFRAFTVKSTLTAHMKTHTGIKEYKCHVCHKMFATHGSLKVHLRLHTGTKPFDCPHCDKKFRTSGHRKTHIASHFKDASQRRPRRVPKTRPQKPDIDLPDVPLQEPILITDTGFIQQPPPRNSSLYNQYLGSGLEQGGTSVDRPYKCGYCAKGFKKSSHLKQHIRSHTGERPFKCLQCGKCFVSSGVLKAHSRTHTGMKAYKCLICDGTFTTNGSLKRHMSTHSEVRPFMCPYCQKTFKTSVNCKKHMKTHKRELGMQAKQQQEAEQVGQGPDDLVEVPVQVQPVEMQVTTQVSIQESQDTITDQLVEQAQNALLGLQQSQLSQETLAQQAALAETTLAPQAIIQQPLLQAGLMQDTSTQDTLTQAALGAQVQALNTQAFGQQVLATLTNNQHNLNQEAHVSLQTQQIQQQLEAITGQSSSLIQQSNIQQLQKDIQSLQTRAKEAILRTDGEEGKRTYRCGYCGKAFKKSSHLKQHIRSHTGEKPYTCTQCGRSFVSSGVLKAHQRTHSGIKAFKCTVCECTFTTNGSLTRHMNVHTTSKHFACPECGEQFRTGLNLKRHMKQHRGEVTEESEIELPRRTRQVVRLTEEEAKTLAHSNPPKHATVSEKILIQSAAEKGRVSEIVADKHKELEKQPKFANQCQNCPKSFKKPSDLVRHIRIHTGEKPFKCDECGKKFTVKSTLDCHMRTHRGSKLINCHVCNTMFATKGSLKVHMRLHTGAKPFKCPQCNEMFRTSGSRKMHIQNVHEKPPEGQVKKPEIRRSVPRSKIVEEQPGETVEMLESEVEEQAQVPQINVTEQVLLQQQQTQQQQVFAGQQVLPITIAGQETLAAFPEGATILQGLDGLQLQLTATNLGQNFQIQGLDPSITVQIDPSLLQQLQQGSFNPIMLQASDLNLGNATLQLSQENQGLGQTTLLTTQPDGMTQATVHGTDAQGNLLVQVAPNGAIETVIQPQMAQIGQTQVQLAESLGVATTAVTSADSIVTVPFPMMQTQTTVAEVSGVVSAAGAGQNSTVVTPTSAATPIQIHATQTDAIASQQLHAAALPSTTQTMAVSQATDAAMSQSTLTNSQADRILSQVLSANTTPSEPTLGFTSETNLQANTAAQINPNLLSLPSDALNLSQNLILPPTINTMVATSSAPSTSQEASLVTATAGAVPVSAVSHQEPGDVNVTNTYGVVEPGLQDAAVSGQESMELDPSTAGVVEQPTDAEGSAPGVAGGKQGVKITVTEAAASIGSIYQCSEEGCTEVFTQMSLLRQHQSEAHESVRPHVCIVCGKGFKRPGHLKEHMNTHMPESITQKSSKPTPHKCNHCSKGFAKPSQLERHIRIHTGERPFQCPKCEKAFNQKNALNIHMTKHTGEKPYRCGFCEQAFSQKGNLKVHMQRSHLSAGADGQVQDDALVLPGSSQESETIDFFNEFGS